MARIAGVDLNPKLKIRYSLAKIYGVGFANSKLILEEAGIDSERRTNDVSDAEISKVKDIIESKYRVEGELRQEIFRNIKRLKDIRSYRGDRHKKNLPTKGQKSRTNARTRKGKSMAVGGLKRVLTKT